MRHFATRKEAKKFIAEKNKQSQYSNVKLFKKLKGHKNRIKKPFVVGSEFEWLNLY